MVDFLQSNSDALETALKEVVNLLRSRDFEWPLRSKLEFYLILLADGFLVESGVLFRQKITKTWVWKDRWVLKNLWFKSNRVRINGKF